MKRPHVATSPTSHPKHPSVHAWSQILVNPGDTWGRAGEDDWGILACFSFGLSVCSIATSKFSTSEGIARWQTVIAWWYPSISTVDYGFLLHLETMWPPDSQRNRLEPVPVRSQQLGIFGTKRPLRSFGVALLITI